MSAASQAAANSSRSANPDMFPGLPTTALGSGDRRLAAVAKPALSLTSATALTLPRERPSSSGPYRLLSVTGTAPIFHRPNKQNTRSGPLRK